MIPNVPTNKHRHGCLTAWLIYAIVANSLVGLLYLISIFGSSMLGYIPTWALFVLIVISAFNVFCAISIMKWKKFGFWGFCVSAVLAIFINLALGINAFLALVGLIGIAVLYGVLQIGDQTSKAWPQLE